MEIVQFPHTHPPSGPRLNLSLLPCGQKAIQPKIFSLIGVLFLSSFSISLVASPSLAQLPVLEPTGSSTSQQRRLSSPRNESTVALETYALGPGDQIRIDVLSSNELFKEPIDQIVLLDGSITLPWVGKVSVTGLNPLQAEETVIAAYSEYIRNPRITFQLLQPRPIRVGIVGEIKRPGGYTLQVNSEAGEQSEASESRTRFWPSVTQAISNAGGITRSADVRSVQIKREGVPELIQVNLWDLVESGNLRQDVLLRDGDQIFIPTAQDINNAEVIALANTTFAPATITVNVVGEVASPGSLAVAPDTLLNQAILTAGGFNTRARSSRVELIRLHPNGTVSQQRVDINLAQDVNDQQNPILQDGDTIVVGRSSLAATSDTAGLIFSPLTNLLLGLFGIR
ncbi:polysaccharide transporter [Leptolyngbyaceae cyanobacterium CCMR0082]|uniref:Polysaccharide transporter n=2 Tax=Adonisia turfae TaxID=2950184 RepID=A0A6M0SHW3_9CYAN|nr:SLBB domain-containing protein [Adonisia turfae]MDV3348121.1 SLBB domain-containing protein [Leptothoe sp. LEGE 181152]NEZ57044.1 polysaccharide transporter [Adonisia turfae CCMR0081]NEZ67561.1 polysaccharide transporter [Adonisia turfae CCMR0082]